jgi:hypothetical protein
MFVIECYINVHSKEERFFTVTRGKVFLEREKTAETYLIVKLKACYEYSSRDIRYLLVTLAKLLNELDLLRAAVK